MTLARLLCTAGLLLPAFLLCGCLSPSDAGPGDCSASEASGRYRQTNTLSGWTPDDLTLYFDCSAAGWEYEPDYRADDGWWIEQAGQVAIDFFDWNDRTGELRGNFLELARPSDSSETLVYERFGPHDSQVALLTAQPWHLVRYEWGDGTVSDQDRVWEFEETFAGGGDLRVDGTPAGEWFLSEERLGEWDLGVSYGLYLVTKDDGFLPSSWGLAELTADELRLHDDVGTDSARVSVYEPL